MSETTVTEEQLRLLASFCGLELHIEPAVCASRERCATPVYAADGSWTHSRTWEPHLDLRACREVELKVVERGLGARWFNAVKEKLQAESPPLFGPALAGDIPLRGLIAIATAPASVRCDALLETIQGAKGP